MSRVLVLGASGYIGSQLVPRLVAAGHRVRAASRRLEFLEGRGWCGVELVQADALDPETLPPVLEDIDVVYYMVHSRGAGRGFAARERAAAENLNAAAAEVGVARIICLSSQGNGSAGGQRNGADIGAILRSGPVPVSDVRSSVIIGPGSACFEITRDLVRKLPLMVTPRWTRQPVRPVALDELLAHLVKLVDQPDNGTNVHCLAGPEEVTFEALMRDFAGIEGRRPRIIPVPVATPGLSALWLDLTTSLPLHMGRPLIESFRNPPGYHVADGSRITVTGDPPGEAMRRALETERDAGLAARWAEGAVTYRGYNPDPGYYRLSFSSEVAVAAPAEFTWKAVSRIGGNVGYYYGDYLWKIRGVIDRLVGGVGMRRGRRHPEELRAGDALDFWRVAVAEPPRQLTLVAEMKVPGDALLEFAVLDDGAERSRVKVDARFHPSGWAGLVYWYSLLPVHSFIFKHMPRNLGIAAEQAWQESQPAPADGGPANDGALSRSR